MPPNRREFVRTLFAASQTCPRGKDIPQQSLSGGDGLRGQDGASLDAAVGKVIGEPMRHEGRVSSAQFSADGQRVVTASEDKTARESGMRQPVKRSENRCAMTAGLFQRSSVRMGNGW
jgi:hypothetical protein